MSHVRRMDRRFCIVTGTVLALVVLIGAALLAPSPALAAGATQIAGTGFLAGENVCVDPVVDSAGDSADFALILEGDLDGCLYTFVDSADCSPSGTYRELGEELFVGQYLGSDGTFATTYRFEAKYEDCATLGGEIFGRCQHPIVEGSGTGVFAGVLGRLDFKDDVAAGNFPYRGHLRWTSSGVAAQALTTRTAC